MLLRLLTIILLSLTLIVFINFSKYNLIFIFILTALTIINFLINFLNNEKQTIYLVSLISSIVAIYIFEIYSQNLFKYLKNQNTFSKIKLINYDKQNNRKYYIAPMAPIKFKKINQNKLIPLSGLRNVNNYLCVESEGKIFYQSDEFGFNNQYGDHAKEIYGVVLGDSFVQGECVPHENNLTMQLQSKFKKKILNLGLRGSGQLTQYAILKEYGESLKPKLVILIIFMDNDFEDFYEEVNFNKVYNNYLQDYKFSQNLKLKAEKSEKQFLENLKSEYLENIKERHAQSAKARIISILKMSHTRTFLKIKIFKSNNNFEENFLKNMGNDYRKNIQNFEKLVDTWGGKLVCVPFSGAKFLNFKKYKATFYNEIIKILEKNGCDLTISLPIVDQNNFKSWAYTFGGGHLSSYGYERMSEHIYTNIRNNE